MGIVSSWALLVLGFSHIFFITFLIVLHSLGVLLFLFVVGGVSRQCFSVALESVLELVFVGQALLELT